MTSVEAPRRPGGLSFSGWFGTALDRRWACDALMVSPLVSISCGGLIGLAVGLSGHLLLGVFFALAVFCVDILVGAWASYLKPRASFLNGRGLKSSLFGVIALRSLGVSGALLVLLVLGDQLSPFIPFVVGLLFGVIFVAQTAALPAFLLLGLIPIGIVLAKASLMLEALASAPVLMIMLAAILSLLAWVGFYLHSGLKRQQALLSRSRKQSDNLSAMLAAQDADRKLREALQSQIGLGFFDYDLENGVNQWSAGMYEILGVDTGENPLEFSALQSRLLGPDVDDLDSAIAKALKAGEPLIQTLSIRREDGTLRSARAIVDCVADQDGCPLHLHGVLVDDTRNHQFVEEANRMKGRLTDALLRDNSVIWDWDALAGKGSVYGAARHFFGETDTTVGNMLEIIRKFVPEFAQDEIRGSLLTSAKTGETVTFETPYKYPHGDGFTRVSLWAEFHPFSNGFGLVRAVSSDITEEVQRRAALAEASHSAELANQAKSAFLANMSHEIRTPLNGIIAVAGALEKTDLSPDQASMLELITSSGDALNAVLNDVLDLAKIETGRMTIEDRPFSLSELVKGTTALFGLRADEKGLAFQVVNNVPEDVTLLSDPARIRQILSNLISNAIKFTESGSVTVWVSAEDAEDCSGEYLALTFNVIDTGPGVSPQNLAKLFDRFEQLDPSMTREFGGSGLGLAISQSLARLLGGEIVAQSELGAGSSFTLRLELPTVIASEPVPDGITDPVEDVEAPQLRVLAAEDHPVNQRVLRILLEPLGVELELCENGQEAVDAFRTQDFDIVLMDLQMPVMDGLTAIRKIRQVEARRGRAPKPIIAVSANAMSHHREEAEAAGADEHLAKPFTPEALYAAMERVMQVQNTADQSP